MPDPAAEAETPAQAQPLLDEEAWHEVEVVVVERQGKGIRKVTTSNVLVFISVADATHFVLIFSKTIFYQNTFHSNSSHGGLPL